MTTAPGTSLLTGQRGLAPGYTYLPTNSTASFSIAFGNEAFSFFFASTAPSGPTLDLNSFRFDVDGPLPPGSAFLLETTDHEYPPGFGLPGASNEFICALGGNFCGERKEAPAW